MYYRKQRLDSEFIIEKQLINFIADQQMEQDNESSEEQQKRQVKLLMNKISFADDPQGTNPKKYKYVPQSISPFLNFYKLLALRPCEKLHKHKLKLNIPDTIIFNDKDAPLMWMFTNEQGQVCRIDNLPYYTITSKLTEGALDKQIVGVLKKPQYGYGGVSGNDLKVVSAAQIKTVLSSVLSSRNEVSVIQRFVKCHSVKASVMRSCWRRNGNNEGWILTSNHQYVSNQKVNEICKFIVNTKMPKAFNAVKCTSDKYLKETVAWIKNIAKFLQSNLKITFTQLVCDFIKDEGGNWWYVNTKAFILQQDVKVDMKLITMHDDEPVQATEKKKMESYTKCKKCKYCYKTIAQHLMTHKLTLMMILQCDKHLIRFGKSFPWLQRSYYLHLDSVNLYVQHKICDSCYKFYKQIQKLVALQTRLAQLTGIKIPADNKSNISITSIPYFKGHSAQFGTRLQKITYDTEMPQGWQLPRQKQLKIQLQKDQLTVQKYRVMVYLHGIRDIPVSFLNSQRKYSLQYEFLGQKIRVPINFDNPQVYQDNLFKISIEKVKLFYLFAQSRQYIKNYIKTYQCLQISLYQDQERFGILELELDQFKSDKVIKRDFFKMFSGKRIFPYLSWGLFISLGIYQSGTVSTSNIKLAKRDGLLIPELQYYNSDPLPQDWLNMIEEKPDKPFPKSTTYEASDSELSNKSKIISNLLSGQIQEYSRRKAPSSYEAKRKPHYA